MSGDGKRGAGHWPQATAPILDSTGAVVGGHSVEGPLLQVFTPPPLALERYGENRPHYMHFPGRGSGFNRIARHEDANRS